MEAIIAGVTFPAIGFCSRHLYVQVWIAERETMRGAFIVVLLGSCGLVRGSKDPNGCPPNPNIPSPPAKEYEVSAREQHNFFRTKHQAPGLTLHDQLGLYALQCAEHYAAKGVIDSTCPYKNGTGENQYATWYQKRAPSCVSLANSATTHWYNEVEDYDYRQPGFSSRTGSFTQLVWKGSKVLGVGCAHRNGFAAVVALYSPPGNVLSHGNDPNYYFRQNVLPPSRRGKEEQHVNKAAFTYAD